jgi:hypothetical protein
MSNPTKEQLRTARHLGAKAALSHLSEQQRDAMLKVRQQLDDRRERNISEFRAKVKGEGNKA